MVNTVNIPPIRYFIGVLALIYGAFCQPAWGYQDEKSTIDLHSAAKGSSVSATPCADEHAGVYPCENVDLIAMMSLESLGAGPGIALNDAWGWTDTETSHNYALIGREDGTAFVDITDPYSPVYVGEVRRTATAQDNVWRDVKVDGNFAFIVADGGGIRNGDHGMQVFDLRRLRQFAGSPITFEPDALYSNFSVAHNIAINEETHRAYVVGARGTGESCGGGLHIIDINNPLEPTFLGCFADIRTGRYETGYSHDTQCVVYRGPDSRFVGKEICVSSNETAISIADVTNAASPIALSKGSYPASAYVHQGWLTEDHRFFVQNDELDEQAFGGTTRTMIWDLENLQEPELVTVFSSPIHSIDHNLYIRDGLAYQANYTSGLRILDVRDPLNPGLVGSFDTTPSNSNVSFSGTWTAYPFPGSDLVVLSSRGEGMFIVAPNALVGTRFESVDPDLQDGEVTVSWMMKNEHNVDRFVVESRNQDGSYDEVGSVPALPGVGTERSYQTSFFVEEGVYHLRISALLSESSEVMGARRVVSEEVTVVSMNGSHIFGSVFPNPSNTVARSRLAVAVGQQVTARVVDITGKEVKRLYDGFLDDGIELPLVVTVSDLPGGIYFLRVEGERFSSTKEMVVVR